jgi:valyl-tRNA synthetase
MSRLELPKAYEANRVEEKIYQLWEESGFFNPDNLTEAHEPFVISMPPPNVTGILHLGHAFENSLMDMEVRYQRMRGRRALIVPGTDHAAVATQARVEDELKKQGFKNPRQELGREELLNRIRAYAKNSQAVILSQIKKLGTSCDWSRLAYTFDDERSRAVNQLFKIMYDDCLIYKGYRVVNWSVKGQSTCSDDELVYVEQKTKIYTFKYSLDFPIPIATTRPETKLGDTAVAVHPDDPRYQKFIGQKFTVDVGASQPLVIMVIADKNVDPNYGTGALGVTPAHSQIDFEMYQNNKDIGLIQVIGSDGRMTPAAGVGYDGLTALAARDKFVEWLKDNRLFIKEEEIMHSVGTSDRFGDVVEALPMEQWFIDVNKTVPGRGKSLKQLMREAVTIGHRGRRDKIITITPSNFCDIYLQWIDNLRDWCISRQIWWGHRIPVWYRGSEIFVGLAAPAGDGWIQDEDTLDTWFSSGAWTFSTLGWPEQTVDLKKYHPTSWMQMGYEILFFWMARMILMTTYALDDIPFKEAYIHGILRDKNGQKFSKSAGNGLDPLEIISSYGTDALRLSLIKGVSAGHDSRFYLEKVEGARNFVNKLWNISRFILQSVKAVRLVEHKPLAKSLADRWILLKLDQLIKTVTQEMDRYNFAAAVDVLYEFTWSDFADWYLEVAKIERDKDEILLYVLQSILKLWHPVCPFVTEEIWKNFNSRTLLLIAKWPQTPAVSLAGGIWKKLNSLLVWKNQPESNSFDLIVEVIAAIRNLRGENKIEPAKLVKITIITVSQKIKSLLLAQSNVIKRLARCQDLVITGDVGARPAGSLVSLTSSAEICLDQAGLINVALEQKRLTKEIQELERYLSALNSQLNNQEFISQAPRLIVEREQKKLASAREKMVKLKQQLTDLRLDL